MNKIGVVICYFGEWPKFFPFFLRSITHNENINWLIFSDNEHVLTKHPNICFYKLNLNKFNKLASEKTGLNITLKKPFGLYDLRPLYGKIFEDYLSDYTFWGYSDIDIIYGQINKFINIKTLQKYDIISTYKGFLSGPFCLFRNNSLINELYKQSVNYPAIFTNQKYFGFDENIQRQENKNISMKKIIKAIHFAFQYILSGKFRKSTCKELRYQFQWFYKKCTIKPENLVDMTEVILWNTKESKIEAHFKELMFSDRYYNRINKKNWELTWNNGSLLETRSKKNIMAFHFIDYKNNTNWEISDFNNFNGKFQITKKGIQIE